jgi:hypothetical protein
MGALSKRAETIPNKRGNHRKPEGSVNYKQFEGWLSRLDPADRKFLDENPRWKKDYQAAVKALLLPGGFVERTMEILEGDSESEI